MNTAARLIGSLGVALIGAWGCSVARETPNPTRVTTDPCRFDPSGHQIGFVTVEPGVQLEVLDWGGTGDLVVLLTGMGDNAHIYDQFAWQLNDRYHVIGITRRGYGRSSQPVGGYDLATRARDDIAVLDHFKARQASFIGHSIAGTELNELAAAHPERVAKLVYLDALDNGSGNWTALPQPPGPPEWTAGDLSSVHRAAAADARDAGFRRPLSSLCNMVRVDSTGRVIGEVTPAETATKILAGLTPASYDRIRAPTLGIFNRITAGYRLPYFERLDTAARATFAERVPPLAIWIEKAIDRFRTGVKNSRVVDLHDANHYVFIVEEALVARETRKFLLDDHRVSSPER